MTHSDRDDARPLPAATAGQPRALPPFTPVFISVSFEGEISCEGGEDGFNSGAAGSSCGAANCVDAGDVLCEFFGE